MLSREAKRYLLRTDNGKPGDHYNCQASLEVSKPCPGNPSKLVFNKVKFQLCIDGTSGQDRVIDLRFEVFGEPVTQAAAAWCREQLIRQPISEIKNISPEKIAASLQLAFDGNVKIDCETVSEVVHTAVKEYLTP